MRCFCWKNVTDKRALKINMCRCLFLWQLQITSLSLFFQHWGYIHNTSVDFFIVIFVLNVHDLLVMLSSNILYINEYHITVREYSQPLLTTFIKETRNLTTFSCHISIILTASDLALTALKGLQKSNFRDCEHKNKDLDKVTW